MKLNISLLFFLFVLLSGCGLGRQNMGIQEYSAWANSKNYPYYAEAEVSKITYGLQLYTTDLEVARAVVLKEIETAGVESFKASYAKTTTAILKISLPDPRHTIYDYPSGNELTSSERASYFSFDFTPAFKAVSTKGDTVNCVFAGIERGNSAYHIANANLEFPLSYADIRSVIYMDKVLSESTVVFTFTATDKKQSPKLKL